MSAAQTVAPNDWFEHPELLPPRPLGHTEVKYTRRFAIDLHGAKCHDQYVFLAPNGLAVIGLAPSHPLVAAHRRATGYQPTQLRYIQPTLDHLKAEDLVLAVPDEDGPDDAEAGASRRPDSGPGQTAVAPNPHDGSEAGAAAYNTSSSAADQDETAGGESLNGPGGKGEDGGRGQTAAATVAAGCGGGSSQGRPERPPVPEPKPFPPSQCSRINFEAGAARNQLGSKSSGKKRGRGAALLRGTALLGQVEQRGGGSSFPIWVVLRGQLLEINERLLKTPDLLYDRPCREGYVAILSPTQEGVKYMENQLVSEQEYLRLRGLTAEDLL